MCGWLRGVKEEPLKSKTKQEVEHLFLVAYFFAGIGLLMFPILIGLFFGAEWGWLALMGLCAGAAWVFIVAALRRSREDREGA